MIFFQKTMTLEKNERFAEVKVVVRMYENRKRWPETAGYADEFSSIFSRTSSMCSTTSKLGPVRQ